MASAPIISFKAGICDLDVNPRPTPGYVYLYEEDEMIQFCWRSRATTNTTPELKLTMVPSDGSFQPLRQPDSAGVPTRSMTNGRIFVLRFQSSSTKYFFWLQSKVQNESQKADYYSDRDLRIGSIVDALLQGNEEDAQHQMQSLHQPLQSHTQTAFNAKQSTTAELRVSVATSPKHESISNQATNAVRGLLKSLEDTESPVEKAPDSSISCRLSDLLSQDLHATYVATANVRCLNALLVQLPWYDLVSSSQSEKTSEKPLNLESLPIDVKRKLLMVVLRSPQFSQSLQYHTQLMSQADLETLYQCFGLKQSGKSRPTRLKGSPELDLVEAIKRDLESQ